jgi:hypothetical protein
MGCDVAAMQKKAEWAAAVFGRGEDCPGVGGARVHSCVKYNGILYVKCRVVQVTACPVPMGCHMSQLRS